MTGRVLAAVLVLASCAPQPVDRECDDEDDCDRSPAVHQPYPWWMFGGGRSTTHTTNHVVAPAPATSSVHDAPKAAPQPHVATAPAKVVPKSPAVYQTYKPRTPSAPIYRPSYRPSPSRSYRR